MKKPIPAAPAAPVADAAPAAPAAQVTDAAPAAPAAQAIDELPRIIDVVHKTTGRKMTVSKAYYLAHAGVLEIA